jgi:homoserine kinase type II
VSVDASPELRDILQVFDLGELAAHERNERGFCNTSYHVDVVKDGKPARYFVRKYKREITEEELQFEHSVINRVVEVGSPPVAALHRTRDGKTYLHRYAGPDDTEGSFYAVFDFLPDEDRYTWVGPCCPPDEIRCCAVVQAQFHRALNGFTPQGHRVESKIIDLLPEVAEYFATVTERSKGTVFDAYLAESLDFIRAAVDETTKVLSEPAAREMPQLIIHSDYHPGNLKFRGCEATGLFDFDWSKVDWRAFDVADGLWYFFCSWEGAQEGVPDGLLRLDDVATYLDAYQGELLAKPGLEPVSPLEAHYLPYLVEAASHYVMYWGLLDWYSKDLDPDEYLVYLRHSIDFSKWFRAPGNFEALRQTIEAHTAVSV